MAKKKSKQIVPSKGIFVRVVACACALLIIGGIVLAAVSIY